MRIKNTFFKGILFAALAVAPIGLTAAGPSNSTPNGSTSINNFRDNSTIAPGADIKGSDSMNNESYFGSDNGVSPNNSNALNNEKNLAPDEQIYQDPTNGKTYVVPKRLVPTDQNTNDDVSWGIYVGPGGGYYSSWYGYGYRPYYYYYSYPYSYGYYNYGWW